MKSSMLNPQHLHSVHKYINTITSRSNERLRTFLNLRLYYSLFELAMSMTSYLFRRITVGTFK